MIYYRYHDPYDGSDELQLQELPVLRETAKCVVLQDFYPRNRYVLKDPSGKRYAYPSKWLALASYIVRKERQIQHGRNTVHRGEAFLDIAKTMRGDAA